MKNSKVAFTMIELIFVIVILGILVAVAIPRLSVTRNDAEAAKIALELGDCIEMASGAYVMSQVFDIGSPSCDDVSNQNLCFTLTPDNVAGTLTVTHVVSPVGSICDRAQLLVVQNGLSANAPGVTHGF